MRESDIERYGCAQIAARGGIAYKFTSPGRRSVPDRLVLWPGGFSEFIEFKAPGQRPTPLQAREHEKLRALGFVVNVIDSKAGVDALMSVRQP